MNISTALNQIKNAENFRKTSLATAKFVKPINKIAHRYGPEILTGVGIAAGITAGVLGAKATLKLEPIVDQINFEVSGIREEEGVVLADRQTDPGTAVAPVTHGEVVRRVAKVKLIGALDIAKLYAPTIGMTVGSITCILAAHGIMRRRNVAIAAAYTALEKSFETYRNRVVDEFGKEKDKDFRLGFKDHEKTDKKTNEKHIETTVNPDGISVYARFFDEGSPSWSDNPGHNIVFLRAQQAYLNERLQAFGYVFLNEAYDALGIERTRAGAVVGWILGPNNDNYVDFGIYDFNNDRKRMFVNGTEKNILLDFNVDGFIQDKI